MKNEERKMSEAQRKEGGERETKENKEKRKVRKKKN